MNIRKLNEELDRLLKQPINEISSELKQWAKDERNARYLAAQATADREKAKLDRLNRTIKATEPKEEKEVKNSLTQIAKDFCKIEDCSYSTPEIDGKDFYIVLSNIDMENGKLTKTAEEKLKELLAEMTEKYGCKYSYTVEGTKVKIICEKPIITRKTTTDLMNILINYFIDKYKNVVETYPKMVIDAWKSTYLIVKMGNVEFWIDDYAGDDNVRIYIRIDDEIYDDMFGGAYSEDDINDYFEKTVKNAKWDLDHTFRKFIELVNQKKVNKAMKEINNLYDTYIN